MIYYDIVRLTEAEEDALGVRFVLLEELLRTADVVTLHVPLTASTQHLITTRTLGPDEAQRRPDQHLPGPRRRDRAASCLSGGQIRRRRPGRDDRGAARAEAPGCSAWTT